MPSSASASITPLVTQGGPPMAPDSPQPLAPSGLVRQGGGSASVTMRGGKAAGRGLVQRDHDRRNVVGARDAVVLVARGEELAVGIVRYTLIQRLADALR